MELFYLVSVIYHLNPFVPNVAFLYPNIRKSYRCFLGVEKEWLGNRWVKVFHTSICTDFFPQLRQFLYGLYFCFSLSTPMLFWNGFPVVLLIAFYCFRTILCFCALSYCTKLTLSSFLCRFLFNNGFNCDMAPLIARFSSPITTCQRINNHKLLQQIVIIHFLTTFSLLFSMWFVSNFQTANLVDLSRTPLYMLESLKCCGLFEENSVGMQSLKCIARLDAPSLSLTMNTVYFNSKI